MWHHVYALFIGFWSNLCTAKEMHFFVIVNIPHTNTSYIYYFFISLFLKRHKNNAKLDTFAVQCEFLCKSYYSGQIYTETLVLYFYDHSNWHITLHNRRMNTWTIDTRVHRWCHRLPRLYLVAALSHPAHLAFSTTFGTEKVRDTNEFNKHGYHIVSLFSNSTYHYPGYRC